MDNELINTYLLKNNVRKFEIDIYGWVYLTSSKMEILDDIHV